METTSNGLNNSNDVETPQESAIPETENQMQMEPLVRKNTVTIDPVVASELDKGQKISDVIYFSSKSVIFSALATKMDQIKNTEERHIIRSGIL